MSAAGGGGGAGAVVRSGHLRKLKTMKKKYFVLRAETPECSARLEYYESEKKFKSGALPRRVVSLKSCYNITRRLDLKQKHVIALFTKEEQFCVVAENEQDLHAWLSAILKQHRNDDASDELLHPIQHVWQVNVQKKGLGATKNIQGLYNLCLTDKTITLVKIKSQNNVISDLGIPERIEYALKNIRRCGDSECFFYMEVGRQTATGSGELWMHTEDANIAQSMHSTILHAMRNCARETENERDHIVIPKRSDSEGSNLPPRRQSFSDGRGRGGLANVSGLCAGSCIRACVSATGTGADASTGTDTGTGADTGTRDGDDSACSCERPLNNKHAENQPPNNSLTDKENPPRVIKHHRTISLPTGCPLFQEPLRIVHERTRSAPLTGDEVDRVVLEKAATYSSCKAVNGTDVFVRKSQWSRRASTGARLSKLSPAHSKNAGPVRSRCESMPSQACSTFEVERPATRHTEIDGVLDSSRDETDSVEWHRTPRIPEEPDFCDSAIRDLMSTSLRSYQHSRTSSLGFDDSDCPGVGSVGSVGAGGGGGGTPHGYVPMAPALHDVGRVSSSGSVCSGTPSTDPRFSEYQLEPATSHIVDAERPPRAYSVGSRPAARDPPRHRAYSVGARSRPPPRAAAPHSAPHLPHAPHTPHGPRAAPIDLMELDFSNNSNTTKLVLSRTPPASSIGSSSTIALASSYGDTRADEYVDMSPRNAGYVEMRPRARSPPPAPPQPPHAAEPPLPMSLLAASPPRSVPDGYVEMNYGRASTRPIAIGAARAPPAPAPASPPAPPPPAAPAPPAAAPAPAAAAPRTPLGSQTIFPLSIDSPASPPDDHPEMFDEDEELPSLSPGVPPCGPPPCGVPPGGALWPLREEARAEEARCSPAPSCSPSYVKLAYPAGEAPTDPGSGAACKAEPPAATVVLAGAAPPARFSVETPPSPPAPAPPAPPLHYAALDLEPRAAPGAVGAGAGGVQKRLYTQIDFARSEKLAADHN